jgi:hypothetical protein
MIILCSMRDNRSAQLLDTTVVSTHAKNKRSNQLLAIATGTCPYFSDIIMLEGLDMLPKLLKSDVASYTYVTLEDQQRHWYPADHRQPVES